MYNPYLSLSSLGIWKISVEVAGIDRLCLFSLKALEEGIQRLIATVSVLL